MLCEVYFVRNNIKLLDCTLRDGAYINNSHFGEPVIKGIIKRLQDAGVDIIECGWLKDFKHEIGSSFFHVPKDLVKYVLKKSPQSTYVAMIDWDRYDTTVLPLYDGCSIDAVRVVFPCGKHKEGIEAGRKIRERGYKVFFQAANTLAYSDKMLESMAQSINEFQPEALSVVDTFGAMYAEDLSHIVRKLDSLLKPGITLGFHSHNNQQLSFALSIQFIELLQKSDRKAIVDSSLCGMGRGAGNATTELVASYLNRRWHRNYDMDSIMDAIDTYMQGIQEQYNWGYSTPYFIAGMYQCHVNNIIYLQKNHRTSAKDMRNVISSLSVEERRKYDYDLLEKKYMENQGRVIDDSQSIQSLQSLFDGKTILLIAPGKSSLSKQQDILSFIEKNHPIVIGVNAICVGYRYDYLFFTNMTRYEYAHDSYREIFDSASHILLSNIKRQGNDNEYVINFNRAIKRGWEHFDNAVICALRLLNKIGTANVVLAGFDGFKNRYNESYADASLPTLNPDGHWDELNEEIRDMYLDVRMQTRGQMEICFLTASIFDKK